MSRFLLLICAALAAYGADLRAGFAVADLTPPPGLEMAGFGPFLARTGNRTHDPLMAHAVVLEAGGKKIAIVGCDLIAVTRDLTQAIRRTAEAETGIPANHILVSASHTHSGPATGKLIAWGEVEPKYLDGLAARIARAVVDASKRLQTVDASYGEVPVDGIGQNREYKNGPVDRNLRVLKFTHSGRLAGFIVHHSVHNVIYSEQMREYTSDLTGVGIAKIVREHPGAVGVYLQGSCGDINPAIFVNNLPPDQCEQLLEELSGRFAAYVRAALDKAAPYKIDALDAVSADIRLPQVATDRAMMLRKMLLSAQLLKDPGLSDGTRAWLRCEHDTARAVLDRFLRTPLDAWSVEIQAVRVHDLLILTNPGETFIEFADQIERQASGRKVWVAGYANDYVGYIPTADRYDLTGERFNYAAHFVPMMHGEFRFREDVGDVLVKEMTALGARLTGR